MTTAAADMNLDDLLADLSGFPSDLENFHLPEFGTDSGSALSGHAILGYGANFGGVDYAQDTNVFGVHSSPQKATAAEGKGANPKRPSPVGESEHQQFCGKCCLVPAEVDCPDCKSVLCAYCDYETHSSKETVGCKQHDCRVMLCRKDVAGKDVKGSTALQQLWQLEGLSAPAAAPHQPASRKPVSATQQQKVQQPPPPSCPPPAADRMPMHDSMSTHMRLDDQFIEFFKTDEFAMAVSKVADSMDGVPLSMQDELDELERCNDAPLNMVGAGKRMAPSAPTATAKPLAFKKVKREPGVATAPRPMAKKVAAKTVKVELTQGSSEGFVFRMQSGPADIEGEELETWWCVRTSALERWKAKKLAAKLNPQIRYRSRKKIADSRPRVKGRFVKTAELVTAA